MRNTWSRREFGASINSQWMENKLLMRNVAAALDIDTST